MNQILLLLGRDLLPAHHILEQRLGPIHAPFAQRLRLGWVIIGDVCLGTSHKPDEISVMKTFTLKDGRTTLFQPCMSNMHVANDHIFEKRKDDDTPGLSYEDKQFLEIMDKKMYKGPDLMNSLLGILLRFRQGPVAITADIEQMFYRFSVSDDHRNYLRFMWYKDNEPSQEMIEYRMTRHVFGNSPSPAVATFGLRKCVSTADEDVKSFVLNNFYVDDALMSVDTCEEAISILSRTQTILKEEGNIRLHKVSSNSLSVIKSFPTEDLAKEVIDFNLDLSEASLHSSLGVSWDVFKDYFTFRVYCNDRPFTKRGLLATINSLYDPIGFVSPVTIGGKFILQDVMSTVTDWDEPLSQEFSTRWRDWKESLINLESVVIPRCYANLASNQVTRRELHVFSDASSRAIGAVAYLRIFDVNGDHHISFVHGKSRVAPTHGHTIPRLELCAAVLACNIKNTVTQHLSFDLDSTTMYTDSKIVLGYINNERRRFYVYVSNRVDMIRQSTSPNQWTYISSEENPADIATRSIAAIDITQCAWIQGPTFLHDISSAVTSAIDYQLIEPSSDIEVRPLINASKTTCASQNTLGVHRFERFSDPYALLRAIAHLKRLVKYFSNSLEQSKPFGSTLKSHELLEAEIFVLKEVQWSCFSKEISALKEGRNIPKSSAILPLTPILDDNGILRVGGHLKRYKAADALDFHPVIIPRKHHIGELIIRHCHEGVQYQGRHLTEENSEEDLVNKLCQIYQRRELRLHHHSLSWVWTLLAHGLLLSDVLGVVSSIRRDGGIIFTCLVCRAIHIEVVEELSSSSFINAARRFIAIRGPVRQFRSDRGTNFVGAAQEMGIDSIFVEDPSVRTFLNQNRVTWVFNPPHASHFGGGWERMIGTTRRILDAMLLRTNSKGITHEILTTFMAEVCSIINSRPIIPVSSDSEDSAVLTPNILLTQKIDSLPNDLPELELKMRIAPNGNMLFILHRSSGKSGVSNIFLDFKSNANGHLLKATFKKGM
ncbi:uncharacterized protein LOC130055048 [Ostrea edulis]|uniref:uncharacterized protein LOC130055048 n=1 Tax=Ostrea edulis TaxID=37623 RepID=UPI0024AFFD74|nr:uncharacterized protein LOC130055048 [Ostrea edulis]